MAKLSYDQRRELVRVALNTSRSVDDPSIWVRDIYDDEVVYDAASPGKGTFRRSYVIDDSANVTLGEPVEVVENRVYVPVVAAKFSEDGNELVYEGKLFAAGEYPDKGMSFTTDDIAAMAANFVPVDLNIEHRESAFDMSLGKVVKAVAQGSELFGVVRVPKEVRKLVGKAMKMSLEIDRATKRIIGCAIVLNPRVTDAQVVAAFSADPEPRKGESMSFIDRIKTALGVAVDEAAKDPDFMASFTADSELARLRAENAELKASRLAAPKVRLSELATEFADGLIKEGKALPAEKDGLEVDFSQAALDDHAETACFSADGAFTPGKRVQRLKDRESARKPHGLLGVGKNPTLVFGATAPDAPKIDSAAIYARINGQEGK